MKQFRLWNANTMCFFVSAPDPAGGAYSAPPDPLAGLRGPTSKGKEGRGGKGEGREVEGRERDGVCTIGNRHPQKKSWLRHCK